MRIDSLGKISLENTLVFIFIILLIGIFLGYYGKLQNISKERLAQEQVYNINTAIAIFLLEKKRFPKDLNELTKEELLIENQNTIFKKKFLDFSPIDTEGYPLDPWGRRFKYDRKNNIAYIDRSS